MDNIVSIISSFTSTKLTHDITKTYTPNVFDFIFLAIQSWIECVVVHIQIAIFIPLDNFNRILPSWNLA